MTTEYESFSPFKASETKMPYRDRSVTLISVDKQGQLTWTTYLDPKRRAVESARSGESTLYAAWTGQYATHIFLVDDLDIASAALAAKKPPKVAWTPSQTP
jgi:hypothetical protein